MNIFFLDYDPEINAQYYVDKHVVKIITECNQLLSNVYPNGISPYKHSHFNHPMSKWIRSSLTNFNFTVEYCDALCKEYTYRYNKIHKGESILEFIKNNLPNMNDIGFTNPPRCFGDYKDKILITDSIIEDYRNYYKIAKSHLFSWKKRNKPYWI